MSVVEITYSWYNPRNPKCRNCASWDGPFENYSNPCVNQKADVSMKPCRPHNMKACRQFSLKPR